MPKTRNDEGVHIKCYLEVENMLLSPSWLLMIVSLVPNHELIALVCVRKCFSWVGLEVFLVFMLRHKILKSKFNRPAKLLISLGVR